MSRNRHKALVIALGALATLAFALPAAAQAQLSAAHWEVDGVRIPNGEANAVDITTAGTLTLTVAAAGASVTCDVTDEGRIWNDPNDPDGKGTSAYDDVTNFVIDTPCDTSIDPACDVDDAPVSGLPWLTYGFIDASRGDVVEIDGISFSNHFEDVPECGAARNLTVVASGSLTPRFNDATDCFEFDSSAGTLSTNVGPATVTGEDCAMPAPGQGTDIGLVSGA